MKVYIDADGILQVNQQSIDLPQKQVNCHVFVTPSSEEHTTYLYCFYQKNKSRIDCQSFSIQTEKFEIQKMHSYNDVIKDVIEFDKFGSDYSYEVSVTRFK